MADDGIPSVVGESFNGESFNDDDEESSDDDDEESSDDDDEESLDDDDEDEESLDDDDEDEESSDDEELEEKEELSDEEEADDEKEAKNADDEESEESSDESGERKRKEADAWLRTLLEHSNQTPQEMLENEYVGGCCHVCLITLCTNEERKIHYDLVHSIRPYRHICPNCRRKWYNHWLYASHIDGPKCKYGRLLWAVVLGCFGK